MNTSRIPSLILAIVLQVLPVTRVFVSATSSAGTSFAIVSTWLAGLGALLGSYNAVSGASTTITSPATATATNGNAFTYRVTTGPDAANWFAASNLPPGLTISTTVGRITGTPTTNGVYSVLLTASDDQRPDRTIRKVLTLTVKPRNGGFPIVTGQPQGTRTTEGSSVTLTVSATGPDPLRYMWRKDGAVITGETNSSLNFGAVSTNQAGTYNVYVASQYGVTVSSNAVVTVVPAPRFTNFQLHDGQLDLGFVRESGAAYEIQFKEPTEGSTWQQWTNWPASASSANTTVTASSATAPARLYQIRMTLP
ncbi:MAG: immunoglobulin domain-containing protein [Verrucomicrobia bacterium]|nr:immunoglobulin domain-containing protein [Verrucomicrobiota bacterium]